MRRRRTISKAAAQEKHFRRRARERGLDNVDSAAIVRMIQSGRAEFVRRQSKRVGLFAIELGDERRIVVYDRERKAIVTVLPSGSTGLEPGYGGI